MASLAAIEDLIDLSNTALIFLISLRILCYHFFYFRHCHFIESLKRFYFVNPIKLAGVLGVFVLRHLVRKRNYVLAAATVVFDAWTVVRFISYMYTIIISQDGAFCIVWESRTVI